MSAEWIKTAKVGDKVVCVDGTPSQSLHGWLNAAETPVVGAIYTIKDTFVAGGRVCFDLEEIDRDPLVRKIMRHQGYPRIGYGAYRFRPVDHRKTDISIFTDMLKTVEQPVKEEA